MNMNQSGNRLLAMTVVINGDAVLEYDRSKPLPELQAEYLQRMNQKMGLGIELNGHWLSAPDVMQQAQFVAIQLYQALAQQHDGLAAASTAWLANSLPEIRQIRVEGVKDLMQVESIQVDFVTDREHTPEHRVDLIMPEKKH
ncbi:MAG: hypothetical protein V3W04_13185 [Gammaproteobacteria bacterium]